MYHVVRTKLMLPSGHAYLPRPRLTDAIGTPPRVLVLQAPAGAGKTTFLTHWLPATGLPYVYYRLDQSDSESGAALAAHLRPAFAHLWPDWRLPDEVDSPAAYINELVSEAGSRPPVLLALDGLEAAFGRGWLTELCCSSSDTPQQACTSY